MDKKDDSASINRNFSRIRSKEEALVLFEKSRSGYNILHDVVRLSPTNARISVNNFKYLRYLLFRVFKQQELHVSWHFKKLLLDPAEYNISVLSSAVATGNDHLVLEILRDLEHFCSPEEFLTELKRFEIRPSGDQISLFEIALHAHRAPVGQRSGQDSSFAILCFLRAALKKVSPADADEFVFECIERSPRIKTIKHEHLTCSENVDKAFTEYLAYIHRNRARRLHEQESADVCVNQSLSISP